MSIDLSAITKGPSHFGWQSKLDRLLRISTFGDSTATLDNAGKCNRDGQTIPFPSGSITQKIPAQVAALLTKVPCIFVGDGGIFGNTVQQMLDRSSSTYSETRKAIVDVIGTKPDLLLFHGGSINDLILLNAIATDGELDVIAGKHIAMVKEFTESGIFVLDCGVLGYSSTGVTDKKRTIVRDALLRLNQKIKTAFSDIKNAFFIDVLGVTHDATGAYLPLMSTDGTHLNAYGGNALGVVEASICNDLFAPSYVGAIKYDSQKDYANNYQGQPLKHSTSTTACTVNSKVTKNYDYTINYTTTNATNKLTVNITSIPTILAALESGDVFDLSLRFGLFDENGDEFGAEFSSRFDFFDGTNHIYYDIETAYVVGMATASQRIKMPVAGRALNASSILTVAVSNVPVGTYSLKLKPFGFRG